MTFISDFKPTIRTLFMFGLCPFSINTNINKLQCTWLTLICSFGFSTSFAIFVNYALYRVFFENRAASEIFEDTFKITRTVQRFLVALIYYVTIITSIKQRKNHVKFLNHLDDVNKRLENIIMSKVLHISLWKSVIILLIYLIFNAVGSFIWRDYFSDLLVIYCFLHALETTTIMLSVVYIRYLGLILLLHFTNLCRLFKFYMSVDLSIKENCLKLINIVDLLEELNDLKRIFNKIFGFQMLINAMFDIILITVALYTTFLEYHRRNFYVRSVYHIFVYIMPHVIKNIMMVRILDLLAKQVFIFNI